MENITPGQVGELIALFAKKLPLTLTKVRAQEWIDDPDKFELMVSGALMQNAVDVMEPVSQSLFAASDTNLNEAIALSERFSKEVLGITVDLRKMFNLPTKLSWKNVMLVYDPGLNNRQAVELAISGLKLQEWEEENVMKYSGSARLAKPTLHIIENSTTPTADTLGDQAKSPYRLNEDGRIYLDLRNYALAFGQRFFGFKDYLDQDTWTWFPKNRLRGGGVARGCWRPRYHGVRFCWYGSGRVGSDDGARLAIPVPLNLGS